MYKQKTKPLDMKFDSSQALGKLSEILAEANDKGMSDQLKALDKARSFLDNIYRSGYEEGLKIGKKKLEI